MQKIQTYGNVPQPRFGHTLTLLHKNRILLFGGATGNSGQYSITDHSYLFDVSNRYWKKLEASGSSPSPRAAHAACSIQANQLVIFGGANGGNNGGGCLASDDLFLLQIFDDTGSWNIIKIVGNTPGKRYGHTLSFVKPFLVVFGGNTGSQPVNDCWILNVQKSPLTWQCLSTIQKPCPRVYHSAAVCTKDPNGLMTIFGGRQGGSGNQIALNDIWILRKHKQWQWIKAKSNKNTYDPIGRYQHSSLFISSVLFIIGGRTNSVNEVLPLQVYQIQNNEWHSFNSLQRFRHGCWFSDKSIYIYGGFQPQLPNIPNDSILKINLLKIFQHNQNLLLKLLNDNKPEIKKSLNSKTKENMPPPQQPKFKSQKKFMMMKPVLAQEQKHSFQPEKTSPAHSSDILEQPLPTQALYEPQLEPQHILLLCQQVEKIIKDQPIVLKVKSPVKIFGDIHGQFSDLMSFFSLYGSPWENGKDGDIEGFDYVFLGDFVDRGKNSLQTILLLFALKIKYPKQVHLIRGNHQDKWINCNFGFSQQCSMKLNQDVNDQNSVYNTVNRVFEYLPLGALIQDKILCLHGGIGVSLKSYEDLYILKRPLAVQHQVNTSQEQLIIDVLWSDPTQSDADHGIIPNQIRDPQKTGNIVRYGPDRVQQFLKRNNLNMIIRAHQCVMDGFQRFAGGSLITVFSATDYCGRHKNAGAILILKKNLQIIPKLIYPTVSGQNNWIQDEQQLKKRPPTPPRWKSNGQRKSYQ